MLTKQKSKCFCTNKNLFMNGWTASQYCLVNEIYFCNIDILVIEC